MSKTGSGPPTPILFSGSAPTPTPTPTPASTSAPTPTPILAGDLSELGLADASASTSALRDAFDEPVLTDIESGAAQLLSTAFPDGVSDPFATAQDGWVIGTLPSDPYSGIPTGNDGLYPYTGSNTTSFSVSDPVADNYNNYIGGNDVNPSDFQNVSYTTGSSNGAGGDPNVPNQIIYDNNGNAIYYKYIGSDGVVTYVPTDPSSGQPNIFAFPEMYIGIDPPQTTPTQNSAPQTTQPPTPAAPTPDPSLTQTPQAQPQPQVTQPNTPTPQQTPPPVQQTAPDQTQVNQPAPPAAPPSSPITQNQIDEQNWSAAKSGMWDSLVDLAQGLIKMTPGAMPFGPQLSLDFLKSGPPAPTGNPARDAELLDNYKSGGWVTTTVSIALPIGAEGILDSAMVAMSDSLGAELSSAVPSLARSALGSELSTSVPAAVPSSLGSELAASVPAAAPSTEASALFEARDQAAETARKIVQQELDSGWIQPRQAQARFGTWLDAVAKTNVRQAVAEGRLPNTFVTSPTVSLSRGYLRSWISAPDVWDTATGRAWDFMSAREASFYNHEASYLGTTASGRLDTAGTTITEIFPLFHMGF